MLIDGNVPPQPIDIEFINTLGHMKIPYVIAYTKVDKPKKYEQIEANIAAFQKELLQHWEELPQQFITSASKGTGKEEVLNFIGNLNKEFYDFYDNL